MKRVGRYLCLCLLPGLLLAFPDRGIGQEQKISILNAKIKKANSSLSKVETKIDAIRDKAAQSEEQAKLAQEIQHSIDDLLAIKREGQTKAETLEAELIENYQLLQAYRNNYRYTSELSKDDALGDLTLKNGSQYSGAIYSGASNIGIQVSHSGGVGNVPYDQLPSELAAKFQTPPDTQTTINVPSLLATKPSFNLQGDAASDPAASDPAEMDDSPAAKREHRIAEANEERAAIQQKKANFDAQLGALEEKLKQVSDALKAQENAKYDVVHEQQVKKLRKRTRTSATDMARITDAYDQKISALQAQRQVLYDEIKELRRQRPR